MLKGRWGGVVDTVGGNILATAIRSTKEEGALPAVAMPCRRSLLSVFPLSSEA